jgi:DivIVA domain-containing protein
MPFAPHEIENKKFVVAMRGYQTEEVDGFLRAVAADYRALMESVGSASREEWMADIERIMSTTREEAEREAAELRAAAVAEAAAVREAAVREAAELRDATQSETEAYFTAIERQAEELHQLEKSLWMRIYALEQAVVQARATLAHVAEGYPMPYGGARPSLADETNVEAPMAPR